MRPYVILWIILLMISISSAVPKEIAYVFSEEGEHPLVEANLTDYNGNDMVLLTVEAGSGEKSISQRSQKTVDYYKREINEKINIGDQLVRDEGLRLIGRGSGLRQIDQICSIYDYVVDNWTYVSDWRGLELFQYSNYTLNMGQKVGSSGKGDCDDFAILMASLIASIGGTPRIILAYGPDGGHAYAEVYLGKKGSNDRDIDRIIKWLRFKYQVNEIYYRIDPISGDTWLNLDWWRDSSGPTHPGRAFYQATTSIPIFIQENLTNTPITPIENWLPIVSFNYTPIEPEVGRKIDFDASLSSDPDGKIVNYEWNFGDRGLARGSSNSTYSYIYSKSGRFLVKLTLTDNEGNKKEKTLEIDVNAPLRVNITSPRNGESVSKRTEIYGTLYGDVPKDHYIWIIVEPSQYPGKWWPQGNHSRAPMLNWVCTAIFRGPTTKFNPDLLGTEFTIDAILVNEATDKEYKEWNGTYGLEFPENSKILDSVKVKKMWQERY